MKKFASLVSMAVVSLVFSSAAHAGPILTVGNNPQTDENVLLNTGLTGNPLFGLTNQTGASVKFLSNETIVAPANGQARVAAQDGALSYLDVSVPGGSFLSLILDLDASADGTVDFSAWDTDGNLFTFNDVSLGGAGNNFFTFTTNGLAFSHIAFTTDAPMVLVDAEQFRIGGARMSTDVTAAAVPEPMTLLMLGSGMVGCATRLRRKMGKR